MPAFRRIVFVGLVLCLTHGSEVWAQMHKCLTKDGRTIYQEQPCPADAKASAGFRSVPSQSGTTAAPGNSAPAQGVQAVEDKDIGVRFTIPKDWEWRSRGRDIFVNCAPKIESRPGMPGCYITVQKFKLAQGQSTFTDADRDKWKSATTANGMRPFVSARDVTYAGFPAYEVVVKQATEPGAAAGPRVFMLIPGFGVVDAWLYAQWENQDQTQRFESAFQAALNSLRPIK